MRFARRTAGRNTEFWVSDVDPRLRDALETLAWEPRDGGWVKSFAGPAPEQAARAFANIQFLLEPLLSQYVGMTALPGTDYGPAAANSLEAVRWHDWEIRVPPLHLQRAVSALRGMADRVALIDSLGHEGCNPQ